MPCSVHGKAPSGAHTPPRHGPLAGVAAISGALVAVIAVLGCLAVGHGAVTAAVLRVGTAEQVFEADDGALILFVGCEVAGRHARASFAHSEPTAALCSFLDFREDTSVRRVASVFGAPVVVVAHHRPEVARSVHVVAAIIGAYVVVVAHDVFAEVLSANAVDADAIIVDTTASARTVSTAASTKTAGTAAIEVAGRSIGYRAAPTCTTATILLRALVAVVRAHHALAWVWIGARAGARPGARTVGVAQSQS